MRQVTVIGSDGEVPHRIARIAEEVGRAIAGRRAILVTGGRGGVMEAACKGAKDRGGCTVGILPGSERDANPYVDIVIVTGMGTARNVINVLSADVVLAIHGGTGTISEIGLALTMGKKVVALRSSGGVAEKMAGEIIDGKQVLAADSADEAIKLALGKRGND